MTLSAGKFPLDGLHSPLVDYVIRSTALIARPVVGLMGWSSLVVVVAVVAVGVHREC